MTVNIPFISFRFEWHRAGSRHEREKKSKIEIGRWNYTHYMLRTKRVGCIDQKRSTHTLTKQHSTMRVVDCNLSVEPFMLLFIFIFILYSEFTLISTQRKKDERKNEKNPKFAFYVRIVVNMSSTKPNLVPRNRNNFAQRILALPATYFLWWTHSVAVSKTKQKKKRSRK